MDIFSVSIHLSVCTGGSKVRRGVRDNEVRLHSPVRH